MGSRLPLWAGVGTVSLPSQLVIFWLVIFGDLSRILTAPMKKVAGTNTAATQQSTMIPKAHMSGIGVLHSGMRESPKTEAAMASCILLTVSWEMDFDNRCSKAFSKMDLSNSWISSFGIEQLFVSLLSIFGQA